MNSYVAFLGHQPHISLAELSAVFRDFQLTEMVEKDVAMFETAEVVDQEMFDCMGGTIFIAKRITEADISLEDIPKLLKNETQAIRGKVTFSLRGVGVSPKNLKTLYRLCKQTLKDAGKPARYVGSEKKPAQAILIHDSGVLDVKQGCELTIVHNQKGLWVGRTIVAQDVDYYTWRDMDKPVRDTTVGLLPPKLAQIMLNMGLYLVRDARNDMSIPKKKTKEMYTVYDPFCGTGVIPLEAMIRGWNVLASDISQKAVNGTSKNIEWLRKEQKILKKDVTTEVWKHDATNDFNVDDVDVIVTETTLGPNFTSRPNVKDVAKLKTENEKIQIAFLTNAAKNLPDTPIVCCWPVWKQKNEWVHLEKVWNVIEDLEYEAVLPPDIVGEFNGKPSLFYRRAQQFVGREIVLLRKK